MGFCERGQESFRGGRENTIPGEQRLQPAPSLRRLFPLPRQPLRQPALDRDLAAQLRAARVIRAGHLPAPLLDQPRTAPGRLERLRLAPAQTAKLGLEDVAALLRIACRERGLVLVFPKTSMVIFRALERRVKLVAPGALGDRALRAALARAPGLAERTVVGQAVAR